MDSNYCHPLQAKIKQVILQSFPILPSGCASHIYIIYRLLLSGMIFCLQKETVVNAYISQEHDVKGIANKHPNYATQFFLKLHIMYSTPPLPKHTHQVRVLGLKKFLITLTVRDVVFFSCVSHFPTDTKDQL